MEAALLLEGVRLMGVGMTTVFAFLGILVVAMHANRAIAELLPGGDDEGDKPPPGAAAGEQARIAVVLAAVAAARGRR